MSDAEDDATPGVRRAPGDPSPALGPAPWERFFEPPPDDNVHRWQAEALIEPTPDAADTGGCHTGGGVSVADLIAKMGVSGTADRRTD